MTWVDQAGNEDGYRVEWSADGSTNWTPRPNLGANSTNYSHTGLSANTEYFYRVVAFNSAGDSGVSITASATTNLPPPYVDYIAQGQTSSEGLVSGGFANTHSDDGSVQSITEQESNGNPSRRRSSLSHRWTFLNVSPGTSMTLTANAWSNGSSDNDDFQFAWSTDGSSYTNAFVVSSTSSVNSQSVALPAGLSGTVYIQVTDTDNTQGNRALDTVFVDYLVIRADNTPVTPPADPTTLAVTSVVYNQVSISWNDIATDETGYSVERSEGSGFSVVATLAANAEAYSDNLVNDQTTYNYRVRALKGATGSGYSNTVTATTPIQPVGAINLSANDFKVKGKHQVDLSWSGSTASSVDVYRDGSNQATIGNTSGSGFYNDNIGAKGGATYEYEVCPAGTLPGSTSCSNTVTVVF